MNCTPYLVESVLKMAVYVFDEPWNRNVERLLFTFGAPVNNFDDTSYAFQWSITIYTLGNITVSSVFTITIVRAQSLTLLGRPAPVWRSSHTLQPDKST